MHWVTRTILGTTLIVVVGASFASAQIHESARWGFRVKAPSGWTRIPPDPNERWIVDKFLCKRTYVSEENYPLKPEMRVIVFPHSRTKRSTEGADAKKKKDKDKREQLVYRNYRDYLKRTFSGGGYYFTTEDTAKRAGVAVEMLEAKVDKNARAGKQRIIAWVFKLQDCDVAVDFVVFEKSYKSLKSDCYKALKSFKLIERDANAPTEDPENTALTRSALKKMSPAEVMRYRRDRAEETIRRIEESLPDGWRTTRSTHYFVATNASKRYTKKSINQAEAIRGWLDENLGEIGNGYVPTAILRVCKTKDDENAYRKGSGDAYDRDVSEITVCEQSWDRRYEMEWVASRVCSYWFGQKNQQLVNDLPPWILLGIGQYVGTGMAKGKRLVFKPNAAERESLKTGAKEGKLIECKAMVKLTMEEFQKAARKGGRALIAQAGSLARYFFSNRAKSNKKTKNLVPRYLEHLGAVVREQVAKDEKNRKKRGKTADTEEEELKQRKAEKAAAKKRARYVVDETFRRTFADWTDSDWKKLHGSWKRASL